MGELESFLTNVVLDKYINNLQVQVRRNVTGQLAHKSSLNGDISRIRDHFVRSLPQGPTKDR